MAKAKTVSNTKTVSPKTNQVAVVKKPDALVQTQQPIPDGDLLLEQANRFALSEELTVQITEASTELTTLQGTEKALVIKTKDQELEVRRLLDNYKRYIDRIDEERTAAKAKALLACQTIDGRAKVHTVTAKASKDILVAALKVWDIEQARLKAIEDARLKKIHDEEVKAELERAAASNEEPRSVMPPPSMAEGSQKRVVIVTSSGEAKTQVWRDRWKWQLPGVEHPELLGSKEGRPDLGIPAVLPNGEPAFVLNVSALDRLAKDKKSTILIEGSQLVGYNDKYI